MSTHQTLTAQIDAHNNKMQALCSAMKNAELIIESRLKRFDNAVGDFLWTANFEMLEFSSGYREKLLESIRSFISSMEEWILLDYKLIMTEDSQETHSDRAASHIDLIKKARAKALEHERMHQALLGHNV